MSTAVGPGSILLAVAVLLGLVCGCAQAAIVVNASFDQGAPDVAGAPPGWQIAVYGAQPTVALDDPAPGLRGHSLRIEASQPSDTAIYQDVPSKPGGWYRLSGWVRTRDLRADTPIYGAFCASDGPSPYASTPNLKGTNGWRHEEILFRAPLLSGLRIAVFLSGFGKGTGTVWFDGLSLEPVEAQQAMSKRLIVTADRLEKEPISPYIYGNFIEFLDNHVQVMRAQMLDDTSFEGILPLAHWCYWERDKDVHAHAWLPTGCGGDGKVDLAAKGAFNGDHCCRIAIGRDPGCGWGIRQGGLPVHAGHKYTLSLYLRQEGMAGPVQVTLGRDHGIRVDAFASATIPSAATKWTKYSVVLTPDLDAPDAELSLRIASPGTLYVDQVTLMPEDQILGWRRDVVEAVRAMKPNCLRFGGSAVIYYDWKKGIGDPDRRVPFPNKPWGGMNPNDVGIDEFLQFCDLVAAAPLVCVSYGSGSPADAAAEVEYCNGSTDTKWGGLRARNGHPKPYDVRLWQVGNEQSGPEYEAKLPAFCRAMLAVDPSIEICSSLPTDGVLEHAASLLDYISPHYYEPSLSGIAADIAKERDRVARLGHGRNIRLAVTEWNSTAGDWGPARALLGTQWNALFCARVLQLYQRNSDFVAIANRSNLTNSFWAGVLQTRGDKLFVTPAYYTMKLMSTLCGSWPLRVVDEAGHEPLGPEHGCPLDVGATLAADRSRLTITVVNDGPDAVRTTLDLGAFVRERRPATLYTLAAAGPYEMDDLSRPQHVRPVERKLQVGKTLRRDWPAWSLTVLVVPL